MLHRFKKVVSGLFRGSAPTPVDVVYLKYKYNINKIVSLDKEAADKIHKVTELLKIKHVIIPITFDRISLLRILSLNLKKLLLENGPTYIHCLYGKDRTGLVIALLQCKYLGKDPDEAIKDAKEIGFGIGIDPRVEHLYEKIIHHCKLEKDVNYLDIVSLERDYIGDKKDSYLDKSREYSFSPYLDQTRKYPYDAVYNFIYEQSPTRENYKDYKSVEEYNEKDDIVPLVGLYNSDAGGRGFGFVEPQPGGFIYD
jgi:protein tyrosine/serine phosphatase